MAVTRDVIVISDTEEGELIELDDCDNPEDEREEGELLDDDTGSCVIVDRKEYPVMNNSLNSIDTKTHNRTDYRHSQFHRRPPIMTKNIALSPRLFRPRVSYPRNRFFVTPQGKTRRKPHYNEAGSDPEPEEKLHKSKTSTAPKNSSKSSLKFRLSNMLKYSSSCKRVKRPKMSNNVDKENSDSLNAVKPPDALSNDDNFRSHISKDISENSMSDDEDVDALRELALRSKSQRATNSPNKTTMEDVDVLRELALQSKTRRVSDGKSELVEESNVLNVIENNQSEDLDVLRELALKSKTQKVHNVKSDEEENCEVTANIRSETDKELEELRLEALKSAMIKKALKRKRSVKEDRVKDKKQKTLTQSNVESDFGIHMFDDRNNVASEDYSGNFMYDYEFYYAYPGKDTENVSSADRPQTVKENVDTKDVPLISVVESESLDTSKTNTPPNVSLPEKNQDTNLIVRLGESDTESECETTKNLIIMHKKLTKQVDFQRNLDMFLKGARQSAVENGDSDRINSTTKTTSLEENSSIENRVAMLRAKSNSSQQMTIQKNATKDLIVTRDNKRILRPSMLINRKPSFSENTDDRGRKVLQEHMLHLRRKIAMQKQSVKQVQNNVKNLQEKKAAIMAQIRALTFSFKNTENAYNLSQRTLQAALNKLAMLQNKQELLQTRYSNLTQKKVTAVRSLVKAKTAEKNISQENTVIKDDATRIVTNTARGDVKVEIANGLVNEECAMKPNNVPNGNVENKCSKLELEITKNNNNNNSDNNDKENHTNDDNVVSVINSNSNSSNTSEGMNHSDYINSKESSTRTDVIFIDYKTPLLAVKLEDSLIKDPQAIWCPFQVCGHCKDASCKYFHLKT